jgi:hypothetical protein
MSFNFGSINVEAILLALGNAVFTHQISFRVGPYVVTAVDVTGAPVHFTYASALVAAEMALAGQTGSVQSGDIKVTVGPAA